MLELSKNHEVYVNGKRMNTEVVYNPSAINMLSSGSGLKKFIPGSVKQILRDLKVFKDTNELFDSISTMAKPDVIIELMRYGSDLGIRLKKHFNIPLIAYFDAPSVEENKYLRGTYSPFYNKISKLEAQTILEADSIIVYSEAIKDYWVKKLPKVNTSKFAIFQTLDYTRLQFVQGKSFGEPLTIGFVGSFLKWHRVENLVKVFNLLKEKEFNVKLLLIGAGEEFQTIQQMVNQSKWKDDITLTGFIDGEKLREFRNKIDIGIMPGTHWYCMPTKVFEYGASGIVSIVPGTDSIRCMFKEDEVLFLDNDTEIELQNKLEYILNQKHEMKNYAAKLQAKIYANNSLERASAFYNDLIKSVLN